MQTFNSLFLVCSLILAANGSFSQNCSLLKDRKSEMKGIWRDNAIGFSLNKKGYIGLGKSQDSGSTKRIWRFNPKNNTWKDVSTFKGAKELVGAVSFTVNGKAFIGLGGKEQNTTLKKFWSYTPDSNYWTSIADFPGKSRAFSVGYSLNGKGFVGLGSNSDTTFNDFWQYNPAADRWKKVANFKGSSRGLATTFTIDDKAYVGLGAAGRGLRDTATCQFWRYNPDLDKWSPIADFPGKCRAGAVGYSYKGKGIVGLGGTQDTLFKDFWAYLPDSNEWRFLGCYSGTGRWFSAGFKIGNKGYFGTGIKYSDYLGGNKRRIQTNDFWSINLDSAKQNTSVPSITDNKNISNVYPNPILNQKHVNLKVSPEKNPKKVIWYNINGAKVKTQPLTNYKMTSRNLKTYYLNLPAQLNTGIYFLKIFYDKKIENYKLIVK